MSQVQLPKTGSAPRPGGSPYMCGCCQKYFSTKHVLERHRETVLAHGDPQYPCTCGARLTRDDHRRRHQVTACKGHPKAQRQPPPSGKGQKTQPQDIIEYARLMLPSELAVANKTKGTKIVKAIRDQRR